MQYSFLLHKLAPSWKHHFSFLEDFELFLFVCFLKNRTASQPPLLSHPGSLPILPPPQVSHIQPLCCWSPRQHSSSQDGAGYRTPLGREFQIFRFVPFISKMSLVLSFPLQLCCCSLHSIPSFASPQTDILGHGFLPPLTLHNRTLLNVICHPGLKPLNTSPPLSGEAWHSWRLADNALLIDSSPR